jgi:hypothetical protein
VKSSIESTARICTRLAKYLAYFAITLAVSCLLSLVFGEIDYSHLIKHEETFFPPVMHWHTMDGGSESWVCPGYAFEKVQRLLTKNQTGTDPEDWASYTYKFELGREIQYCSLLNVVRFWGSSFSRGESHEVVGKWHEMAEFRMNGSPTKRWSAQMTTGEDAMLSVMVLLQAGFLALSYMAVKAAWRLVYRKHLHAQETKAAT